MEAENGQVANEATTHDQPGPQTDQANEEVNSQDNEAAGEKWNDRNFKQLREEREALKRERDEALSQMRELEAKIQQPPQPEPKPEPEEDYNFDVQEDDLIEGRHIKKILKRQEKLESELKQYKEQSYAQTAETRVKAEFPDVEKVLSQENIKQFEKDYPDLSYSISSNPDTYSRYRAAYKAMKQFGIYKEDKFADERTRAEDNMKKPRPLTSVAPQQGEGPLSRANAFASGLTEELKAQLRKEMSEARKNY